jgi:hypothetical protein
VHPKAIWRVFKHTGEILQYQLIKHSRDLFLLRVAAPESKTYQRVIAGILTDSRHILGENGIIEAENYQKLERQGFGKLRPVISLSSQE